MCGAKLQSLPAVQAALALAPGSHEVGDAMQLYADLLLQQAALHTSVCHSWQASATWSLSCRAASPSAPSGPRPLMALNVLRSWGIHLPTSRSATSLTAVLPASSVSSSRLAAC